MSLEFDQDHSRGPPRPTPPLQTTHPFYLDMTESAIMIYDREMFFARKLDGLRARLEEIGAFKSVLPSGQWFWVLAKDASAAEKLVL